MNTPVAETTDNGQRTTDNGQKDLIPVRALNQVSYCPRLYYLEYVEAVMPINEHVEDGLFQHRRVNDPALANRTRKEGDALRTRSVSISSERLGISGKLDLLEEKGAATRPVEYKRSAAPKDKAGEPTFWDNDAIQLCAQGLLVEESLGVTVPAGILYYIGSKARVDVPFDESLRARTMAAIDLIRELSARDVAPEPLPAELRHRCFGCSLAPVCLPEETLYLIHQPAPEPTPDGTIPDEPPEPPSLGASLTRVIAMNDDKAVLYLHEPGSHVGRRSAHLVVSHQGREVNRVPIASVRQVVVFGNVQVSTQALHTLAEAEIPVSYLSGYGKFIAAVMQPPAKNMALRAGQYRTFSDPERALGLARAVVAAKIANQRTLLMRSLRSQWPGTPATDEPPPEPASAEGERTREGEPPCEPEGAGLDASPLERRSQELRASRAAGSDTSPTRERGSAANPLAGASDTSPTRERGSAANPLAGASDTSPTRERGSAANPLAGASGWSGSSATQRLAALTPEPSPLPKPPVPRPSVNEPAARDMADLLARVPTAPDLGVLLGLEGQAAALYFANFGRMLKARSPGAGFDFTARNRRPPRDPVNALLSFAYSLLAKDCFSACCTVGFDPYHGFYHVGRHGRPSLALDLMEEFRPVIADSVVLNLINNGMLTERDFLVWRDACQLTDNGRATFFKAYEQRKATEVTHPVFGYRMSYGRMLEVQARMLAANVRGELPRYVGFTVR